jgi:hypothetical protein
MPAMISGVESTKLKIIRAEEHLRTIDSLIYEATARPNAYEIISDADGQQIVNFLIEPPSDVAILAGEIVYQLRSAIDHLAFELVKLNPSGIALPEKWDERCLFPMWTTAPKGTTYNCFGSCLPGISKSAFALIERFQPYHSGEGPHNILRIIAKLSNIDKHRHLNAILPRVAVRQDYKTAGGIRGATTVGGFKHGAILHSMHLAGDEGTDPIVNMQRSFLPYVTFEEIAIGVGPASLEAQNVLQVCTEAVKSVIVPALVNLLKNP